MCQNMFTYDLPGGGRYAGFSHYGGMSRPLSHGAGASGAEKRSLTEALSAANAEDPCRGCTLVADPDGCNNKNCRRWQAWFVERWNAMRKNVRDQYRERKLTEVGIMVGGSLYAPPHRREEFLREDPCLHCGCPEELCRKVCQLRTGWLEGKKEVCQ